MENLNVTCETCNKGKLFVGKELRHNHLIGCDGCDNVFWATQISYDALLRESRYNSEEDVRVLNENGCWSYITQFYKLDLQNYAENMNKIYSIEDEESKEVFYYYKSGATFLRFVEDLETNKFILYYLIPIGNDSVGNLMAHFEKLTPNPIDGKQGQI